MKRLLIVIRRLPFTTIGFLSYTAMLITVLVFDDSQGRAGWVVLEIFRLLSIPAYVSGLAVTILSTTVFGSVHTIPGWFSAITVPLMFVPFIALDGAVAVGRRIVGDEMANVT